MLKVPPPIPSNVALITGPTMLGICLNWGFAGIVVAQVYFYYSNFPGDRKSIKALIYGLAMLDIIQTGLVTADAFHWFVHGFGNMDQLNDTFLNSWDVPLIDSVISLIVQIFYCWRIYVLRSSVIFPALIVLVSVAQCAAGVVTAVKAHQLGKLSLISTEVIEQTIWLAGSAVADVAIAVVLCWTLLRARQKATQTTHGVINRIVRLTVETNALTAGVAVLALILFLAVPHHSTLVVPPTAIIGKLYTNCLIAVLNNRPAKPSSGNSRIGHGGSSVFRVPASGTGIQVITSQKVYMDPAESSMELSDRA
ncbi:hypothetical protein C8R46DRAFT_613976 [Mycena filopes]|nr:hypothetical protein C8R46DRAFT_613976 [Mycena filopes]